MTASDWDRLLADINGAAGTEMFRSVGTVIKRAAVNVKKDWRANAKASSGTHARAYPYSVTFDGPTREGFDVFAVVGPDKDKPQGALGNLLEYGDGGAKNPPHNDGKRAADAEAPKLEKHLATELGRTLKLWGGK